MLRVLLNKVDSIQEAKMKSFKKKICQKQKTVAEMKNADMVEEIISESKAVSIEIFQTEKPRE